MFLEKSFKFLVEYSAEACLQSFVSSELKTWTKEVVKEKLETDFFNERWCFSKLLISGEKQMAQMNYKNIYQGFCTFMWNRESKQISYRIVRLV